MEAEWEEDVSPLQPMVAGSEFSLGQRERMAQVQATIHVRERERDQSLLRILRGRPGVRLEQWPWIGIPSALDLSFYLD